MTTRPFHQPQIPFPPQQDDVSRVLSAMATVTDLMRRLEEAREELRQAMKEARQ